MKKAKIFDLSRLLLTSALICNPLSSFAADGIIPPLPATQPGPMSTLSPYQLSILNTGEEWDNVEGGLRRGLSYMNNLDAKLDVNTDKAWGWTGGQFVLEGFMENAVSTGNKYVGAVDQQSPIDAAWDHNIYRLYQAYYDQNLGSTDLRLGIYDLESEFSTTKPMSLFLSKDLTWNTAFDQSGTMPQNGNVGPGNYPYTPLAFRIREDFSKEWSAEFAIANGIADSPYNQARNGVYFADQYGALGIGEVDFTPDKYSKVMVGIWDLTSKLPSNNETNLDGSTRSIWGQEGGYIGAATRLYRQDEHRGLDGFLTLGFSNPTATNTFESLNGGLVYTGLLNARPMDKAGISFNVNAAPGSYERAQNASGMGVEGYETSFEATYRARVADWLTVQPDVQYIVDPGYNPALKNDLIIGVHFEIGHLFNL